MSLHPVNPHALGYVQHNRLTSGHSVLQSEPSSNLALPTNGTCFVRRAGVLDAQLRHLPLHPLSYSRIRWVHNDRKQGRRCLPWLTASLAADRQHWPL